MISVNSDPNRAAKVFVDNCVISHAEILQGAIQEVRPPFSGVVKGFQRKPLPSGTEQWLGDEIRCLPTVARLAREGKISLWTYFETQSEAWKRQGSFPRIPFGSVFQKVPIMTVDPAIECSYFIQAKIGDYVKPERLIGFCRFLIKKVGELIGSKEAQSLPPSMQKNLSDVDRLRELCTGLAEKQFPDAFHLWTAETHGLEYFLTVDRKFINAMTQSKNTPLHTYPCTPAELLNVLGVVDRDPFPFKEGVFYDVGGNPLGPVQS